MYSIVWATPWSSLQILLLCCLIHSCIIAMLKPNSNSIDFFAAVYIIKVNALTTDLWQIHYFLLPASGANFISTIFSTLPILKSITVSTDDW